MRRINADPGPQEGRRRTAAIVDLASKDSASDEGVLRVAAVTRFAALDQLYMQSSADDKKNWSIQRIEALSKALEFVEDTDQRLNLAELYEEKKGQKSAPESLLIAANRVLNEIDNPVMSMTTQGRVEL